MICKWCRRDLPAEEFFVADAIDGHPIPAPYCDDCMTVIADRLIANSKDDS